MKHIFPIMFIVFGTFSLTLSKSKNNYQKLVENNGEKFAEQVNKYLKISGYLLLICSALLIGINYFENW